MRYRLDAKAVDFGNAPVAISTRSAEQGARHPMLPARGHNPSSNCRVNVATGPFVRGSHRDPTLVCYQKSIDDVDSCAYVTQQACEERSCDRRSIQFGHFAPVLETHLAHGVINELGLESTEAFSERDIRLKRGELLHAEGRNINGAA